MLFKGILTQTLTMMDNESIINQAILLLCFIRHVIKQKFLDKTVHLKIKLSDLKIFTKF